MDHLTLDRARYVAEQPAASTTPLPAILLREVADRLIDMHSDMGGYALARWVHRCHAIASRNPDALVLYLRAQAGHVDWFARPYSELAKENGRSKQAEHQWFDDALRDLRAVAPDVAREVDAMRHSLKK
jgi:hypothetical protein